MKYVIHKKVKIPLIGFGTYRLGDVDSKIEKTIDSYRFGIDNLDMTLIDTAEMYGEGKSEKVVSKIIKNYDRNKLFIIDKILPSNAKKGDYIKSCKKSLELVGTSYFDLYLLHWHSDVDLQDMVNHMEELVSLGLIKHWGVSNFDTFEMEELFKCENGTNCFCNQILYNLGVRGPEFDLIPWCKLHNVLVMAYSPLYNSKEDRIKYTEHEIVKSIAEKENKTPESVMLSFIIRNNDIATIFMTSQVEHLKNNMKNVFDRISDDDLKLLDSIFPAPKKKVKLLKI